MLWWFLDEDTWDKGRFAFMVCCSHEKGNPLDQILTFEESPVASWLADPAWREWLLKGVIAHWTPQVVMAKLMSRLKYAVEQGHSWEMTHILHGWHYLSIYSPEVRPIITPEWETKYQELMQRFSRRT